MVRKSHQKRRSCRSCVTQLSCWMWPMTTRCSSFSQPCSILTISSRTRRTGQPNRTCSKTCWKRMKKEWSTCSSPWSSSLSTSSRSRNHMLVSWQWSSTTTRSSRTLSITPGLRRSASWTETQFWVTSKLRRPCVVCFLNSLSGSTKLNTTKVSVLILA